jgi:hypothetical protein
MRIISFLLLGASFFRAFALPGDSLSLPADQIRAHLNEYGEIDDVTLQNILELQTAGSDGSRRLMSWDWSNLLCKLIK